MTCVAPGCGAPTRTLLDDIREWRADVPITDELLEHRPLCQPCADKCSAAMREAFPSLLASMTDEMQEAKEWLERPWAPDRRWVIADHEHGEMPLEDVADLLAQSLDTLAFVNDKEIERFRMFSKNQLPHHASWIVSSDEAVEAWRTHAAGLLREALATALATFPSSYAGLEIKTAMLMRDSYDAEQAIQAHEDAFSMVGDAEAAGISPGAEQYIYLRIPQSNRSICDADIFNDGGTPDRLWFKYRVLPDNIMGILEAVEEYFSSREIRRRDA